MSSLNDCPPVLDVRQLARIQAVHRGFLYQHLYGVACLFQLSDSGPRVLTVERDEDLEQECVTVRRYIQVKTRKEPLVHSDVADVLERFALIRCQHEEGRRNSTAEFVIVSNVEVSPSLRDRVGSPGWPEDVVLLTPGAESIPAGLPRPWPDLQSAVDTCVAMAKGVPYRVVPEETLTWKLAALIQAAAAGGVGSAAAEFRIVDLPSLFDQLQIPLQQLPNPPADYRPQQGEPSFQGAPSPLLVIGFSGAGKTAWAVEQTRHTASPVVYFDVGDLPGPVLSSALAREAAARLFATEQTSFASVLRPGTSGLEALRALNACVQRWSERPIVVLDNAHRIGPNVVADIIEAASDVRWVILGQPTGETAQFEMRLHTTATPLLGWSDEQIGAECASRGVPLSPVECERIRRITAGHPMYVLNAAELVSRPGTSVTSWCDDIERRIHDTSTVQELVLEHVWEALSVDARAAAAILAIVDIPVSVEDSKALLRAGGLWDPRSSEVIRELRRWVLLSQTSGGEVALHDAFRVVARRQWTAFSADRRVAVQDALLKVLQSPALSRRESRHVALLLRTMVEAGHAREFMDIVSSQSEVLFEFGLGAVTETLARELRENESTSPEDQFWLTDVLAYLAGTTGRFQEFAERVKEMEALMGAFAPGVAERGAYFTKKLAVAASKDECDAVYASACGVISGNSSFERIIRYQYALGLNRVGALPAALQELEELARQYFTALGLAPDDLLYAKTASVAAKMAKAPDWHDEGKRFADVLSLTGQIRDKLGMHPLLNTIWAMKLYDVSGAYTSLVNAGQDAADHFIAMGDAEGAREMLEQHVLPVVREFKMLDQAFRVRSQYAVVLAYCGQIIDAREELRRLAAYKGPKPEDEATFRRQLRLVEEIAAGRHRLAPAHPPLKQSALGAPGASRKVGRNEQCPCGSGMKYKYCHGR